MADSTPEPIMGKRCMVMSNLPDWSELERRGLIAVSPGREEAVQAALERIAAKKNAELEKIAAKKAAQQTKAKGRRK